MAERVVNLVVKKHFNDREVKPCITQTLSLTHYAFSNNKQVKNYILKVSEELKPYALSGYTPRYLVENYGMETDKILGHFKTLNDTEAELALLKAEVWFTFHHEMITNLQDFFVRRTGLLYFEIRKVIRHKTDVARYLQSLVGWSEEHLREELMAIDKIISEVTEFKTHG
jgi:glycerol-3-phosphate dehydrogenase